MISKGTHETPVSYLSVRVGSQRLMAGGEIVKVTGIVNHPSYNPYSFDFDFCVLRLAKYVVLDGVTKAIIPLPPLNNVIADNTQVLVSGWGYTKNNSETRDLLRGVFVFTKNQASCNQIYDWYGGVTNQMVCAADKGKDSCSVRKT